MMFDFDNEMIQEQQVMKRAAECLQTVLDNDVLIEAIEDRYGKSGLVREILLDGLEIARNWGDPDE